MARRKFAKTQLATSLSLILGVSMSTPLLAQEDSSADGETEVIQVTGIRGSLQEAASIKRSSAGVVDAISAEDIGKFPDTNLAESLQRITGVSISRTNGEGSEVTVRGFAGGNNMITLNGRTMPAAITYGAGSGADGTTRGGNTRSFDFANLASEAIRAVEVYKTGKANIATGGIGATINIITAKPLDQEGFVATAGVKAVNDTTNRTGDDITPEVSAIVSYANDDATWGVSVAAIHQQRDSGYTGATVNNWNIDYWDDIADPDRLWNNADANYVNAPEQGQLYARPNDIRYAFSNTQRTRDNLQLNLQFAPTDNFTGSIDYTFAENEIVEQRGEITNWLQTGTNTDTVEFDNSVVKTPIYVSEVYAGGIDEGYEQQWREQTNTLDSIGVNFEYAVSDDFTIIFDAHDSEMHSRGTGPRGSGEIAVGLGAPTVTDREWFWDGELPTYLNSYDDSIRGANNNGQVDAGDVGSSIARIRNASQKSTITQFKLDAEYMLDNGRFDFGIEAREMESRSFQTAGNNIALGNWGVANPGEFGDLIQPFDLPGEFDDYGVRAGGYGFIADARELYTAAESLYPGIPSGTETALSFDDTIQEDTLAAYAQVALDGEIGDMFFSVLTGIRYEETEVTSTSLVGSTYFQWEDNNDIIAYVDGSVPPSPASAENKYDFLLPSLDVKLEITDDLIGRFSYSKTIARAGLGSLGVSASNFAGGGGSTLLGAQPTANASNPGLLPLESSNVDLSLEWYYDPTSYASVGLFQKDVVNFLGSRQVDQTLLGIRDVTGGPRAQAAAQALQDRGFAVDDTSLYAMAVLLSQPGAFPNGADDYTGTPEQIQQLAETAGWDLRANDSDPLTVFRTSTPDNNRAAKIYGAEFAVQHFFGETGFGVQANYTIVRGDVGFNNEADPNESQFALVGLSDTANLVALYEKDALQARIALNWRDEYLAEVNKGSSNNPRYVEAYTQIDINVSYDISENLTVFFEGLNITEENIREHARNERQLWYLTELGARYNLGARYKF
ncbi:TonB-dependent receptor [Glaciecola sp. 1036]|uniref:TonB-dependent receptor n=1 Tax=Alteromonadaceae TaxID=72275 RepID=UPI003CFF9312